MKRLGLFATILMLLIGAWLVVTPFAIGSQASGAALSAGSRSFLWSGGIVAALAAATLVTYGLTSASDALRKSREEASNSAEAE